jgi:hypothetical protein
MNENIDMIEQLENPNEVSKQTEAEAEAEAEENPVEIQAEIKDMQAHRLGTEKFIESIKNPVFKTNIVDVETNQVVNSIYLVKKTKLGRTMNTMVWQFFRHRGKLNVNQVIKQYKRENLIINYKIFQ